MHHRTKELADRCVPKIKSVRFNLGRSRLHDEVSAMKFICKYGPCFFDKRIEIGG
jgi:hypothetical protein